MNFYSDIIFTSERYLKRQPGDVEAFHSATLRGWQYALEHPYEMVDLILKNYNTQNKTRAHLEFEAEKLSELSLYPTVSLGHMTIERWQKIAEHYQHLGLGNDDQALNGFIYDTTPGVSIWFKWLVVSLGILALLTMIGYFIKRHHAKILSNQIAIQTAALEAELKKGKALEQNVKVIVYKPCLTIPLKALLPLMKRALSRILMSLQFACSVISQKKLSGRILPS